MGASKEGSMSVRERINLVLGQDVGVSLLTNPEEDADEALSASGGSGRGSSIVPTSSSLSSKSAGGGGVGLNKNNNGASSSASPSPFGNPKKGLSNLPSPAGTAAMATPGGGGAKEEPDSSSGRGEVAGGGVLTLDKLLTDGGDDTVELKRLLDAQLRVISFLNIRLSQADSKSETVAKERDQLQVALDSERLEKISLVRKNEALEEQRNNAEATMKEKDEKIRELESRLAAATAPKPVAHQGTLMTPPPPPRPIPLEVRHQGLDGDMMIPRKRRKLNSDEGELLATSSNKIQSYQAIPTMSSRRSDSPPQLSLAVTPKTTIQKPSLRDSGTRKHAAFLLGDRVDDMSEYPPDEFQDELDRINYLSQRSRGEGSVRPIMPSSQHLLPSGSSAFSRPLPRSSQLAKFMLPESKKNFMANSPLKSMQQFRHSLQQHSASSNSLAPRNSGVTDTSTNASLPREPPQLISSRTNNFLNMSRPLARRPQVPSTYQSSQGAPSSEECPQQHSISFDSSAPENVKTTEGTTATPEIPTVVKKRGPGRPPGFRPKKRVPVAPPLTPNSVGITTDTRLSNGALEDLQSKSEPPPPRFSKRGRLLKPNRARYSPDPDNSTHSSSREKFMTTKKSYYVSEPFVPEGYGGSLDGTIGSDTLLGTDADSLPRPGIEEDEPTCPPSRPTDKDGGEGDVGTAFVEVPRWRILTYDEIFPPNQPDERKTPDDMSEEAFIKRHQKPEAQEKQRKRWDLQMLREESYKERMQRKQAERERQKELRRQQRKRKGRTGAMEEEVVNPSVEDIKAINVSQELPVGAFGQTLPINEKVDFQFSSGCASSPLPSPKPVVAVNLDNANVDTNVICSRTVRDAETCSATSAVVKVNKEGVGRKESGLTVVVAVEGRPLPTPPPLPLPSCSSPASLSSLSLPSLPSPSEPRATTPPPPVIFCVRDSDKSKDVYEYTEDDDNLLAPSLTILDRSKIISDKKKGRESPLPSPTKSASSNINDDSDSARTATPIKSASSHKIQPSVTIPLAIPSIKGRNPSGGCTGQTNFLNQLDSCPDSSTNTEQSSTALDTPSKSTSIKFCIPNNPLARPRPRISAGSAPCLKPSSDSGNVRVGDDEQSSKDKNLHS